MIADGPFAAECEEGHRSLHEQRASLTKTVCSMAASGVAAVFVRHGRREWLLCYAERGAIKAAPRHQPRKPMFSSDTASPTCHWHKNMT